MRTVNIPGGTAVIRERADLRVRHRQMMQAAALAAGTAIAKLPRRTEDGVVAVDFDKVDVAGLTAGEAQSLLDLNNVAIATMVESWTLPGDPPRTIDEVGDLDIPVFEALSLEVRDAGAAGLAAETSFEPSDPRAPGFASSPTPSSDGSGERSRDTTESPSTDAPVTSGASTATAPATA